MTLQQPQNTVTDAQCVQWTVIFQKLIFRCQKNHSIEIHTFVFYLQKKKQYHKMCSVYQIYIQRFASDCCVVYTCAYISSSIFIIVTVTVSRDTPASNSSIFPLVLFFPQFLLFMFSRIFCRKVFLSKYFFLPLILLLLAAAAQLGPERPSFLVACHLDGGCERRLVQ